MDKCAKNGTKEFTKKPVLNPAGDQLETSPFKTVTRSIQEQRRKGLR